ncbi:MAG: hypothetical protein GYB68_09455 [Chloroflexi bacterium]|nr:hypothetical protein [Chloroflexota bacterium]
MISASRSILYASSGEGYARAARAEAIKLRDRINHLRSEGSDETAISSG